MQSDMSMVDKNLILYVIVSFGEFKGVMMKLLVIAALSLSLTGLVSCSHYGKKGGCCSKKESCEGKKKEKCDKKKCKDKKNCKKEQTT